MAEAVTARCPALAAAVRPIEGQATAGARTAGGEVGGSSRADQQTRPGKAAVHAGRAGPAATAHHHPAAGREHGVPFSASERDRPGQRSDGRGLRAWARWSRCCRTRPSTTFWSIPPSMVYVERGGVLEKTNVVVQGQHPPDAHHRQDRVDGRPPRRRVLTHGGCTLEGRLARQRHYSAAGH